MRPSKLNIFIALAALVCIAVSCGHKEIDCPATANGIEILFEWDNARDADIEGMTLYFYPTDGHNRIWRFDIAGRDGGHIELPSGTYRMIACNNDLPGISLEDTSSAATIMATASHKVADGVYASTGMLYGAIVEQLEITPCGVSYLRSDGTVKECGKGLVRCRPDTLATKYTVSISNVIGIEGVRTVEAEFGPVYSSMYLDSRLPADAKQRLYLNMTADRLQNNLTGYGCAFSPAQPEKNGSSILLRIVKSDNERNIKIIEISPKDMNIITPHNVLIKIDGIDISDGEKDNVGNIDANVDGWTVIDIDLMPEI